MPPRIGLTGATLIVAAMVLNGCGQGVSTVGAAIGTSTGQSTSPPIATDYSVAGTLSGAAELPLALSGAAIATTTADTNGDYSFTKLVDGTYAVVPTASGYTFTPASLTANVNGASVSGVNFLAAANTTATYRLSGTVSGAVAAGVLITLNGANIGETVTDSNGSFSFSGLLAGGSYTVNASLPGYAFTEALIVTLGDADSTGDSFMATAAGAALSLTVVNPLPDATVGFPYSSTTVAAIDGGNGHYKYQSDVYSNGTPPLGMMVNPNGDLTGTPTVSGTYTFKVCASDSGGELTPTCGTTTLTVIDPPALTPAPTVSLGANPSIVTAGSASTLTWSSTDASTCAASGGWSGGQGTAGTHSVAPSTTTTYTLACTGTGGSTSTSIQITVNVASAPPTVNLSTSSPNIGAGAGITLSWSSRNATACTASGGWTGSKAVSGSASVSPTVTTTYALSCTGTGGSASTSTVIKVSAVTVHAPTVDLTAAPASIIAGAGTILTWASTSATSCTASGGWSGAKATSGTQTESPGATATYTLTCAGAGGSQSASAKLTVTAAPTAAPAVTLTASPTSLVSGSSSMLSWSSTNATSCSASGGWSGSKATNGAQSESPTANSTYSLACTGAGGSTSVSRTVIVTTPTTTGTSWVYYNGTFDWPGDYSFVATPNYGDTTGAPLSGSKDIKVTLTGAYGGWLPYSQNWNFNSKPYTKLTFALKPTVANQHWQVFFVKVGDVPVGIDVDPADYGPAPVIGQWGTYTIPLSVLGVLGDSIYKFGIQDQTGLSSNYWYVDNVGFVP